MNIRKSKSVAISLFEINNYYVSSVTHVIWDKVKESENVYIVTFFVYKGKRVCLNKKNKIDSKYSQCEKDKNIEDKIKKLMKENYSITTKELSNQTGLSKYMIGRFYMKLRKSLNGRIK